MSEERRQYPRSRMLLKVEYPSVDGFLQDYSENISRGGTMVRSSRPVEIGDELELAFSFPGLLARLRLVGIVRWVRHEEAGNCFGIEFHQQDEDSNARLHKLVEQIMDRDGHVIAPETQRILIVEDNPHVAKLINRGLQSYLRRSNDPIAFEIDHAEDGAQAWTLLQRVQYDLVMTDLLMPIVGGVELIRKMRQFDSTRATPLIVFSSPDAELVNQALDAGADCFLPKPLRLVELLDTMRRLVAAREQ